MQLEKKSGEVIMTPPLFEMLLLVSLLLAATQDQGKSTESEQSCAGWLRDCYCVNSDRIDLTAIADTFWI